MRGPISGHQMTSVRPWDTWDLWIIETTDSGIATLRALFAQMDAQGAKLQWLARLLQLSHVAGQPIAESAHTLLIQTPVTSGAARRHRNQYPFRQSIHPAALRKHHTAAVTGLQLKIFLHQLKNSERRIWGVTFHGDVDDAFQRHISWGHPPAKTRCDDTVGDDTFPPLRRSPL